MSKPTVIDLFSGAGGLSLGFKKAGFKILCAYEFHKDAVATYQKNHQGTLVKQIDIQNLTLSDIKKDVKNKQVDVLIGGPPCQGFSTYGKKDSKDIRNMLVFEYIRILKALRPGIFVLENVPGIFKLYKGKFWHKIVQTLNDSDYEICAKVLKASDYGVPQKRQRLILIGTNKEIPIIFPPSRNQDVLDRKLYVDGINIPTEFTEFDFLQKDITIKEAIDDLSFLGVGEISNIYKMDPNSNFQRDLRGNQKILLNHQSVKHNKRTIERYKLMTSGMGNNSLPIELRTKRISTQKIVSNSICRTITSSPEDFVHYKQPRILTIRELARIQTFPDNYEFLGPRTTGGLQRRNACVQSQQIGNAVPPFLAQAVAEGIAEMMKFKPISTLSSHLTHYIEQNA